MTSRAWRRLGLLAVALLLLADLAAWAWAQRALAAGVARWTAGLRAQGVEVGLGGAQPGGWPLAATRTLAGLSLRAGGSSLSIERAVLRLSPLEPDALLVDLPAATTMESPGAPKLRATAQTWTLRLPRPGHGAPAMDARALRVEGSPAGAALTAALLHAELATTPEGDLDLVGSAQSIGLPALPGMILPLGPRIASVALDVALHGGLPASPTAAGLGAWRDAGGALTIRRFALGYGPLGLSGQGRFELDAALQPAGRAALHIVGQAETLDALAAGRVVSAHVAMAAGAVLALLAQPPAGGGAPQVDTTLVVADGLVAVAGFPLLRLPALAWPAGP